MGLSSNGQDASLTRLRLEFDSPQAHSLDLLKMPLIGSYDSFAIGVFDNFSDSYRYAVRRYKTMFRDFSHTKVMYGGLGAPPVGRLPINSMDIKAEYVSKNSRKGDYLVQL